MVCTVPAQVAGCPHLHSLSFRIRPLPTLRDAATSVLCRFAYGPCPGCGMPPTSVVCQRALLGLWAAGRFRGLDLTTAVFDPYDVERTKGKNNLFASRCREQSDVACCRSLNFWQKRSLLSAGGSNFKFTHCREKSYVVFVESFCGRGQIIMWNPPFNVHSTVACSFCFVAIRPEHWKADST